MESQSDVQRHEAHFAQIKQVYQLVSSSIFYLKDLIDLFRTYTLLRSAYIFVRFHSCVQKSNLEWWTCMYLSSVSFRTLFHCRLVVWCRKWTRLKWITNNAKISHIMPRNVFQSLVSRWQLKVSQSSLQPVWQTWFLDLVATAKNFFTRLIKAGSKASQTHKLVEVIHWCWSSLSSGIGFRTQYTKHRVFSAWSPSMLSLSFLCSICWINARNSWWWTFEINRFSCTCLYFKPCEQVQVNPDTGRQRKEQKPFHHHWRKGRLEREVHYLLCCTSWYTISFSIEATRDRRVSSLWSSSFSKQDEFSSWSNVFSFIEDSRHNAVLHRMKYLSSAHSIVGVGFFCWNYFFVSLVRVQVRARNEAKLRRGASLRFVWDEARRSEARFLESRTKWGEARQKLDEAKRSDFKITASTFFSQFLSFRGNLTFG